MEPFPLRPSKFSFEYLLLPPRSAPTAAPPGLTPKYRCGPPPEFPLASPRSGIVHHLSGPDRHAHTRTLLKRSESVGGAPHKGDPTNQLPYALRVYSPVDSHTCQTPWSVFQDGPNEVPAGRCQEHAGAEARRYSARCQPQSAQRHLHKLINSMGFGRHTNPHRSTPRADRRTDFHRSTSDQDASPAHIRFPPDNFKHSLTLFSKSFSSFPRGTCLLSVSRQYLALDGIYRPIGAAFPNNPTRRQRLVVRQGPGTTGLSPSLAPPSRGLGLGPPLRTLLQTTIQTTRPSDFQAGLFPVRSPLLRESFDKRTTQDDCLINHHQSCVTRQGTRISANHATGTGDQSPPNMQHSTVRLFCYAGFDNDPSAGSPTETLLRLLLPLNDKVQWNSRDVAGSEPPTSPRS
ncbi:hypothetical protein R6Q57_001387 [Mikania cordata]